MYGRVLPVVMVHVWWSATCSDGAYNGSGSVCVCVFKSDIVKGGLAFIPTYGLPRKPKQFLPKIFGQPFSCYKSFYLFFI